MFLRANVPLYFNLTFLNAKFFTIRCMECINASRGQCHWCGQDANCQQLNTECPGIISEVCSF